MKSFNGTFINGERPSVEGAESEPVELKTGDIVVRRRLSTPTFPPPPPSLFVLLFSIFSNRNNGIDTIGEDKKTIVRHKVAARAVCVLTEQEALLASHVVSHQNPAPISTVSSQTDSSNGTNTFNFTGTQNPGGPARRPAIRQQGLVGMGGMGAKMGHREGTSKQVGAAQAKEDSMCCICA